MRHRYLLFLWIFLAAPVLGAELRVCVDSNDWSPYTFATHDGTLQTLLRMAAAQEGNSIQFEALPWRRCEMEVEKGAVDALLGAAPTQFTLKKFAFPLANGALDLSRSVAEVDVVLLKKKTDPVAWDGTTLSGLKGGVAYVPAYDEIEERLKELGIPADASFGSDEQNAKAILAGRGNVMASYRDSARLLLLRPEFGDQIEMLDRPIGRCSYYLAFGHPFCQEHGDACDRLWRDIAEIRRRGAAP
jgi:polar amino acid transport system substrate-binding protein